MQFSHLADQEIERRRAASIAEMKRRERADFDKWYQEQCDRDYWAYGQRCSGCDFWQSDMGNLGFCSAAGIVSGDQVMASMGIHFCSYTPPPGLPLTKAEFWCGKFKDEFDWMSLGEDYLRRIGALDKVVRGRKPFPPSSK